MNGAVTAIGANTMVLSPGGALRLNDLDNLRVLATKKGLVLRAGNDGGRSLKLLWKGGASTSGKATGKMAAVGAKSSAGAVQAKAMAASAKSMAVSANALAQNAHAVSIPAAAKVAAGAGLGAGLAGSTLGPLLVLTGMTAVIGGVYMFLRNQRYAQASSDY